MMNSFISKYLMDGEHGFLKELLGLTYLKMMVQKLLIKYGILNFISTIVALIGMDTPTITETESFVSITVCAVLINLIQLEIPLTTFVETQSATATGS